MRPTLKISARRPGVAVLLVLLMLSITLGLSYASLRSQGTAMLIQRNSLRRSDARQAAVTGLNLALKKMHQNSWAGVETTLSGTLGAYESYSVRYISGDPALSPSHADYDELPYRVTLLATGSAADPDNPNNVATHQIEAVVQLIPRRLADEPALWADINQHTVYQWADGTFEINVPCRIEGAVRSQSYLNLANDYPWDNDARKRYLKDLQRMRAAEQDYRPFNGPLRIPYAGQESGLVNFIRNNMGVTTEDCPRQNNSWPFPSSIVSYRVFTGGKLYAARQLNSQQRAVALAPDPATNPLGIYCRSGDLQLLDDVAVRGTLVTTGAGRLRIYGDNVQLVPLDLPALEGSDLPVCLPIGIIENDIRIEPGASATINGILATWDRLEIPADYQYNVTLDMRGRVVLKNLLIHGRSDWVQSSLWWWLIYYIYTNDYNDEYFPAWLGQLGLNPAPRIQIRPDSTPANNHWWQPGTAALYVAHPDDGGLRWDLVRWTDNP